MPAGRPRLAHTEKRVAVTITLHPDVLAWIDGKADDRRISRSSLIERAMQSAMKAEAKRAIEPPLPGVR